MLIRKQPQPLLKPIVVKALAWLCERAHQQACPQVDPPSLIGGSSCLSLPRSCSRKLRCGTLQAAILDVKPFLDVKPLLRHLRRAIRRSPTPISKAGLLTCAGWMCRRVRRVITRPEQGLDRWRAGR